MVKSEATSGGREIYGVPIAVLLEQEIQGIPDRLRELNSEIAQTDPEIRARVAGGIATRREEWARSLAREKAIKALCLEIANKVIQYLPGGASDSQDLQYKPSYSDSWQIRGDTSLAMQVADFVEPAVLAVTSQSQSSRITSMTFTLSKGAGIVGMFAPGISPFLWEAKFEVDVSTTYGDGSTGHLPGGQLRGMDAASLLERMVTMTQRKGVDWGRSTNFRIRQPKRK
jgi:hypothetical protein